MWQNIKALIADRRTLLVVYVALAVIVSIQLVALGTHAFVVPLPGTYPDDIMHKPELMNQFAGVQLTNYNNYLIFKYSWFHLINGTNLYGVYPTQHWDFYKYSPTFAMWMSTIAYLPDLAGLCIWNIVNVAALVLAVRMLPFNTKAQCALLWFALFEMMTAIQNSQSNCLICGLLIMAYGCMQQRKVLLATLWLAVATYIKVYGAIGFCLFLFYPGKIKFMAYAALWMVVLAVMPLLVTPYANLVQQYHNWAGLLKADASASVGISVAGWLHTWFGLENVKGMVTVAGLVLFAVPFIRLRLYNDERYKLLILSFVLLWMIIFNHKAESPTYIIAVMGVGIWYFTQPKTTWRTVLLWSVFLFTSLSATDIFPAYVRKNFIYPYTIKAVPCIIAWCVVLAELMLMKKSNDPMAQ